MRREVEGGVASLDLLGGAFNWVLRIAGIALLAVTGYYIYWSFAVGQNPSHVMSAAEYARHAQNMDLLTKVLLVATVAATFAAIGRFYQHLETGVALLLGGALFFFGMPLIIQNFGITASQDKRLQTLASYLEGRFQLPGLILLGAGAGFLILQGLVSLAAWKSRRPRANSEAEKTAQQVRKKQDQFLGPCWNLPFCRDTDKKLCPVRHSKKPCWRTGRGCYCDQNIILAISGGNQYAASRGATGYLSRGATVSRPKSLKEKREQCLQCPVYLHHQGQKYWLITPTLLVLALGAIAYYWDTIRNLYPTLMLALGKSLAGFSVGPSQGGVPAWAQDLASQPGMMWTLLIVCAMMIIAYLLHGVEWALYKLGI